MQFGIRQAILALACAALAACGETPRPEPEAAAVGAPRPGHIYLVVDKGQSLDRIAQTYRVPKQEIIALNHLTPPYAVKPGTMLEIPVSPEHVASTPKPRPKPPAAELRPAPRPVQTAGAGATAARPAKPKHEPEVIPLD